MFLGVVVILALAHQATIAKGAVGTDPCATRKMDLVVIMDGTISIGYEPFAEQRDFVRTILSKMNFGLQATQVGIIQFSDQWNTVVEMDMGEHGGRAEVLRNISTIRYRQGRRTMTGLAMVLANEQFSKRKARPGVDKVILLITDGKPADIVLVQNVVKELKDKQVKIVTVAIGSSYSYIQRFRYVVRSIASGFEQAFKVLKDYMNTIAEDVANEVCKTKPIPRNPLGNLKGKLKLQQKCFQEKKDILFVLDGSRTIDTYTFNKAKSFVAQICAELDITPALIHVAMLQFSDALNTRIEFGLDQYTKYHQINESLKNVFHSKGRMADLEAALNIVDKQIFNGQNGDRISAEDFVLLFINDQITPADQILEQIQRLKDKGVHVIIIGLGKPADIYEQMASHPSDVNYLDSVLLKHIVGDLTAITCRKVNCEDNKVDKNGKDKRDSEEDSLCQQHSQDVLLMIDTTRGMNGYFNKALKFFTKFVKRLNIAATKTDVGLMTFGRNRRHLIIELGKYRFENDINRKILRTRQTEKWSYQVDVAAALRMANKQIFNTSTGGHRKGAPDLIFIATRGMVLDRYKIQKQSAKLKAKGVRIAVLNVGYKTPKVNYVNAMNDMVSGARDIYPMDFKQSSTISQALLDVQCKVEEKTVSPECFLRSRKVFFMLDRSQGLTYSELPKVIAFIKDIVRRLYAQPDNIEVGLMHYSDIRTARYPLLLRKWSLKVALDRIEYFRYRSGRRNYLGYALKTVRKKFFKQPSKVNEERIVIILAHSEPADPEKAFKVSEKLRSNGVEIVTITIHTKKTPTRLNPPYKALASSSSNAHSFDFSNLQNSSIDVLLNLCELNTCPKDTTKHCTPIKQDIFMLIDSSRSIGQNIYPRLRRFVRRLVNKLDVSVDRTHVGILQASDHRRTQYEMKLGEFTDPKEIESVINEMEYHRGLNSYIGRALGIAVGHNLFNSSDNAILNGFSKNMDRADAENVLMIYTDGVLHDEPLARKQVENLKRRGTRVVIVGLGRGSRKPEAKLLLESIASTRSDVYLVDLKRPSLWVEEELNEVAQHVTTLQCENLYPAPIQCSPESLDLFVVIDGSRSVGYVNFGKVKAFLKKLADEFQIGKNNAHFGVLQYGHKRQSRIEFNLDKHLSNKNVSRAIEKMEFLDSQWTDTGHALSIVNNQIFNGGRVDRPGVPNILILFTDGVAHDITLAYEQAEDLKNKGTRIIVIGAGKSSDTANEVFRQIKRMASRPEDAHKSNFDQLAGIVDDLLDVVCT